ncbi:TetR/AcrR family transcriptional regulator [Hephaestia sp. GCM10023244]|uniref:TetR family transcriptional regulator n=1 Tax=unclassified Hephaestia TaxID=2631281 RepID=UPI0020777866|nr:TetR family transcriptional regulator [Hephaestia sp. MAHUQ-44]MCM8732487.1 TetR/AcrR family transcriptional regulator [Hephaestia sp. MAHUQ-44]
MTVRPTDVADAGSTQRTSARRSGTAEEAIRTLSLDRGDATHGELHGRREQIFFHAAYLFLERGFAATSMSDIAKAVGITKAGLYHFVSDKEELLFTLMQWGMAVLDEDVTVPARAIADPLERLRFIACNHMLNIGRSSARTGRGNPLTVILDEPAGLSDDKRAVITEQKSRYFRFVRATLVELRDQGKLIDVDPSVATFSILGMIVWFGRWYHPDGPIGLDAIADQVAEMVVRSAVKPQYLA